MTIKQALNHLGQAMKDDEGYCIGWQTNIAMAFKDEWQRACDTGGLPATPEQIHEIANKAADCFLNLHFELKK